MLGYGLLAKSYDELHEDEQKRKLDVIKEELEIAKDDVIFDVGCGTGLSFLLGCKVVGIDLSLEMVQIARTRIKAIVSNAESLPFTDKAFAKLICISALHNFSEPRKALNEMRRVCYGRFAITIISKSASHDELCKLVSSIFTVEKTVKNVDTILICR